MGKYLIATGAFLAALAVMTGAFGAHGLSDILEGNNTAATYETAARYHFYHSIAIIIAGILFVKLNSKKLTAAAIFFIAGILLFSGSLYVLSITNIKSLGAITPFGGLFFIIGWVLLAVSGLKYYTKNHVQ